MHETVRMHQSSLTVGSCSTVQGEVGQLQQQLDQRDRDVAILEADIVQALRDVRDACRGETEALHAAETEREVCYGVPVSPVAIAVLVVVEAVKVPKLLSRSPAKTLPPLWSVT